jgi:hypothetical protein
VSTKFVAHTSSRPGRAAELRDRLQELVDDAGGRRTHVARRDELVELVDEQHDVVEHADLEERLAQLAGERAVPRPTSSRAAAR